MADDKTAKGLDRSQPHAQIFGDDQGRIWEQGGRYFNGDGSPWRDRASGKVNAPAVQAAPVPAVAAEDDQLSRQLKA